MFILEPIWPCSHSLMFDLWRGLMQYVWPCKKISYCSFIFLQPDELFFGVIVVVIFRVSPTRAGEGFTCMTQPVQLSAQPGARIERLHTRISEWEEFGVQISARRGESASVSCLIAVIARLVKNPKSTCIFDAIVRVEKLLSTSVKKTHLYDITAIRAAQAVGFYLTFGVVQLWIHLNWFYPPDFIDYFYKRWRVTNLHDFIWIVLLHVY